MATIGTNSDFRSKTQALAAPLQNSSIRECYGVSNSAKFVTGGFLCGIPNLDNLDESAGALCVFSRIQLGPDSELHTAILVRNDLKTLLERLKAMVTNPANDFFGARNQNCAIFLASDGKLYPHNKAKETFALTDEVLSHLGSGVIPDTLFWAIYGNETEATLGAVSQLAKLIGSTRLKKVESLSVPSLEAVHSTKGNPLNIEIPPFIQSLNKASLVFELNHVVRMVASLQSKRFLLITGLAGSGKTKIAQAFARWVTPDSGWIDDTDHSIGKNPNPYYALVPVGADWTGNENIIGYPYGLDNKTYITKPALELVRHALDPAHSAIPHFLILDEMNLSHVERYFADILSAIESGEEIPLYEGDDRTVDGSVLPRKLRLPENLFIIGTVNVDETTYMFSPKVLDRANVIEFRMDPADLQSFLTSPKAPRLEELDGKGAGFGSGFVEAAADKGREVPAAVKESFEREMLLFFNLLREHNAEFGYRTSYEGARFIHFYSQLGGYPEGSSDWFDSAMDAVVVQKFLPKLHGSRSKLEGLLWALAWACGAERIERDGKSFAAQIRVASQAQDDALYGPETLWDNLSKSNPDDPAAAARYPLSYDKVMRMWRKLVRDQFVTFAEA
jgi:energy-coupling factor transporter ATP-binding protein EcfA2